MEPPTFTMKPITIYNWFWWSAMKFKFTMEWLQSQYYSILKLIEKCNLTPPSFIPVKSIFITSSTTTKTTYIFTYIWIGEYTDLLRTNAAHKQQPEKVIGKVFNSVDFAHLWFRLRMERHKRELREGYHEEQECKRLSTSVDRSVTDAMEVDTGPPLINLLLPNGTLQVQRSS